MIGTSFQPGIDDQQTRRRPTGDAASDVQEAIKILSLRLPRVVGAQGMAPSTLLTASGGMGQPDAVVERILARIFGAGGADGGPTVGQPRPDVSGPMPPSPPWMPPGTPSRPPSGPVPATPPTLGQPRPDVSGPMPPSPPWMPDPVTRPPSPRVAPDPPPVLRSTPRVVPGVTPPTPFQSPYRPGDESLDATGRPMGPVGDIIAPLPDLFEFLLRARQPQGVPPEAPVPLL